MFSWTSLVFEMAKLIFSTHCRVNQTTVKTHFTSQKRRRTHFYLKRCCLPHIRYLPSWHIKRNGESKLPVCSVWESWPVHSVFQTDCGVCARCVSRCVCICVVCVCWCPKQQSILLKSTHSCLAMRQSSNVLVNKNHTHLSPPLSLSYYLSLSSLPAVKHSFCFQIFNLMFRLSPRYEICNQVIRLSQQLLQLTGDVCICSEKYYS